MFYPEEIVEEVRVRNDIVEVIGSYVQLQKKGGSYLGLCPFHNEKTPSFSVSGAKQMYHCFGCGVGGNVFTFVMEYENYNFIEALNLLADRVGVRLPELEASKEEKRAADLRSRLLEVQKQAAKYFFYQLKAEQGGAARKYLENRGLTQKTIIHFGLGYSSKNPKDLYQYLKGLGYEDELLRESGLISIEETKGAYDKFWNRVMFPIMDLNNKVIGFGGRVMGEGTPKYLNSPETKLFDKSRNLYGLNFARLSRKSYFLICEGYMDVISLYQAGFTNVVASLGTAFTSLQAKIISRYVKEVLLTYDSDQAGVKATLRAIPILKETGLSVKVVNLSPFKDPDEFIKKLGAEEYQKRLDQAKNSFFFELEVTQQRYNLKDPEQKTKFFNEAAKLLLQFHEELERNNYIEAVARTYHIRYDDLKSLVNRMGVQLSVSQKFPERIQKEDSKFIKSKGKDGIEQSQKLLFTWISDDISVLEKILGILDISDFTGELYQKVMTMILEQYQKEKKVLPAQIISHFESKEEQTAAEHLFSMEIRGDLNKEDKKKALIETILKIKGNSLTKKYEVAAQSGDTKSAQKYLTQQFSLKKEEMKDLEKLHSYFQEG